jgi:hypothetical protein
MISVVLGGLAALSIEYDSKFLLELLLVYHFFMTPKAKLYTMIFHVS